VIGRQRGTLVAVPLPANHRCAVGLLPLPREEFRQLKLILHLELRRRAASRRALPCPSSFVCFLSFLVFMPHACSYLFTGTSMKHRMILLWYSITDNQVKARNTAISNILLKACITRCNSSDDHGLRTAE